MSRLPVCKLFLLGYRQQFQFSMRRSELSTDSCHHMRCPKYTNEDAGDALGRARNGLFGYMCQQMTNAVLLVCRRRTARCPVIRSTPTYTTRPAEFCIRLYVQRRDASNRRRFSIQLCASFGIGFSNRRLDIHASANPYSVVSATKRCKQPSSLQYLVVRAAS